MSFRSQTSSALHWGIKVPDIYVAHDVQCDFPRECTRFAMPYYIFQGAHDNNTPSALVQAYYDAIEAPDKDLIWFEHSAHGPLREEPETLQKTCCEKSCMQWI